MYDHLRKCELHLRTRLVSMSSRMRASSLYRYLIGFVLVFLIGLNGQARIDKNQLNAGKNNFDIELQKRVSDILNTRALRGADVGVVVRSLKTKRNIYEKNADHLLNPASNVKLITTLAALHILKPEFRFKTEYLTDGSNLVVKGYGDPSVTTERLRSVARQLKLRGVNEVQGDLVLDESFFDDQHYARGQDKEINNTKVWAAPVSALSLNRNAFEIFVRPTETQAPAFVSIEPSSNYFSQSGKIITSKKGYAPRVAVASSANSMTVQVSGQIGKDAQPKSFYRRVSNPSQYFGETFRNLLEKEGIQVKGKVRKGLASSTSRSIYVDYSSRLTDLVDETNKISSNFLAEMLVKAIGARVRTPATFEDGLSQIRQFLEQQVGFKKGEYVLGNGSGLNQVNHFSAAQLVQVLEFATRDFEIASEFISSLSVAGAQGTLARRLKDPAMHRRLRGKTGTLAGVSALSGYMAGDKDDVLVFAIIFDGHASSAHRMWQIQDDISRKLAKNISIVDDTNVDLPRDINYDEEDASEDASETVAGGG